MSHTNESLICRDLIQENILLDKEGHIKICDFGLSKQGIFGARRTQCFSGTPYYVPPEVIKCDCFVS
jgi:serine/threonine protein kinase